MGKDWRTRWREDGGHDEWHVGRDHIKKQRKAPIDEDEWGGVRKMRPTGRSSRYQMTTNYKWLTRWLEKQVGLPWDKVYSKFCKELDVRNFIDLSMKNAINYLVIEQQGITEDNVPGYYATHHWRDRELQPMRANQFYIDLDKNLCRMPPNVSRKKLKRYKDKRDFIKHNEVWLIGLKFHETTKVYRVVAAEAPTSSDTFLQKGMLADLSYTEFHDIATLTFPRVGAAYSLCWKLANLGQLVTKVVPANEYEVKAWIERDVEN